MEREKGNERVADLHLWSVGPNIYNAGTASAMEI